MARRVLIADRKDLNRHLRAVDMALMGKAPKGKHFEGLDEFLSQIMAGLDESGEVVLVTPERWKATST